MRQREEATPTGADLRRVGCPACVRVTLERSFGMAKKKAKKEEKKAPKKGK
jgi:hypothetical protein